MPSNVPSSAIPPESSARQFETSDRNPRNVLIIALSAAALVVFSLIVAGIAAYALSRHHPLQRMEPLGIVIAPSLQPLARFPKPNLDVDDDHAQMTALRAAQNAKLNSYGWVDRSNGIVHIPIDRAMELLLQRGRPTQTDDSPEQLIQKIPSQP